MSFSEQIQQFNTMYRLPCPSKPTLEAVGNPIDRLIKFRKTLQDELDENLEIIGLIQEYQKNPTGENYLAALVAVADWLGDIQVYAASEMAKFGLPNDQVLNLIMKSNFSKQNPDGSTTYNEDGKVMKGSSYWKPEPSIAEELRSRMV